MKKIFGSNIVLSMCLGLCPILAVSTNFESAYLMGISVIFVLIFSSIIISLLRNVIPSNIKIPCYILIISTIVTCLEIIINKFVPALYLSFGIYLSLIAVNCVIFGRCISFASKNSIFKSFKDALFTGVGYLIVISFIGFLREFLGNNTITLVDKTSNLFGNVKYIYKLFPDGQLFPINLFQIAAGGFIILGIVIAIFNKIKEGKTNE